MRLRVELPLEFYSALLKNCDIKTPEFKFLKNAVIVSNGTKKIVILNEADRVSRFITWAQRFYPDAADRITITPDLGQLAPGSERVR